MANVLHAVVLFAITLGIVLMVYFLLPIIPGINNENELADNSILPKNITSALIESGEAIGDLPFSTP